MLALVTRVLRSIIKQATPMARPGRRWKTRFARSRNHSEPRMLRTIIHVPLPARKLATRAAHSHVSDVADTQRERASHNLSTRHARLARSIQYKYRYAVASVPSDAPKDPAPALPSNREDQPLIRPVTAGSIPPKPVPPGPEGAQRSIIRGLHTTYTRTECCMSNCAVCVHDLYADALAEWKVGLIIPACDRPAY